MTSIYKTCGADLKCHRKTYNWMAYVTSSISICVTLCAFHLLLCECVGLHILARRWVRCMQRRPYWEYGTDRDLDRKLPFKFYACACMIALVDLIFEITETIFCGLMNTPLWVHGCMGLYSKHDFMWPCIYISV